MLWFAELHRLAAVCCGSGWMSWPFPLSPAAKQNLAMHRTSPLRLRNRISPDTEITPSLDLSTATTTKGMYLSRNHCCLLKVKK
ncbi:uncharacterized protein LOC125041601 isoform X3 [Penaeus chinensis]|uniref:uncharacterized protein LOC125041601 isoform X3 n=1 Tax=Penaeus chinensis TaxID=139456 RepID=UPI001FB7C75F|nr:uncharacterized protein LOC125041601 isoform X3 [Penaeus chinensis]